MDPGRKKRSGGEGTSAETAIPPEAMEMVERVKKVVDRSNHEIYAALVECKMDPDRAINCLMPQESEGSEDTSAETATPPEVMEMVERVKEVVDRSDQEIYAALVECEMDPNRAVSCLMAQHTFHEVKSKCKQKMETKETHESKSEIVSSSSSCGFTGDIHDGGPSISMQMSSIDYGVMHGKLAQEKDNGINTISTSSILSSGMAANNSSQGLTPQRLVVQKVPETSLSLQPNWSGAPAHPTMADAVRMSGCQGKDSSTPIVATAPADSINTSCSTGPVDNFSFFSRPPFGFQQNWSRAPARPTFADVVRMGRCQQKASSTTIVATDGYQSKSCDAVELSELHSNSMLNQDMVLPVELNWESHSSHDHVSNVTEINRDPGGAGIQQTSHEELSLADQPSVRSDQIVSEIFDASANHADEPAPSSLHVYGLDLSTSASDRQVDNSGYGFPHVYGHHEGAPARPTMVDTVRMIGHQGKDSSTPIVTTAPADSINTSRSTGPVDNFSFFSQPPFGFQQNWSRAPARPRMADTVRMSGCQGKDSSTPIVATASADSINTSRSTGPVDNFSFFSRPPFGFQQNWSRAPARPRMADTVRMSGCQGKDSSTPIVATASADSISTSCSTGPVDNFPFFSRLSFFRPPFSFQQNWSRAPARPTFADVVMMGRRQQKASSTTIVATDGYQSKSCDAVELSELHSNSMLNQDMVLPVELNWESHSSHGHVSNVTEINCPGGAGIQQTSHEELSSMISASSSDRQLDNSGFGFPHVYGHHEAEDASMELSLATSNLQQPRQSYSHMQNLAACSSAMALRPAVYPTPQRATQSMPNTSISSGSFLTQHPTLPSYSQPTHPSGHYLPSAAFQQARSGSNAFQRSREMIYRARTRYTRPRATRGISVAPGHGYSWNSANIPGNYRGTRSTVSASRVGHAGGALGSRFMGVNRFLPPPRQQGGNAPRWARGASTRAARALPGSTSFGFQGRNQHGGFQRPSYFATSGYPGHHGSRAVFSEEHQQHLGEGNFDVSQRPSSHKSYQFWRRKY